MRTHVPFSLLATALACSVFAAPAHALRARVYVSKAGADAGGCSFSAPCQSLDFALNGVEPSGEITILDSGGYNPITITKGVTITVPPGVEAGIAAPAGGTAITINATQNDAVVLRGLTLSGANSANFGIVANSAGKIEIVDSVIRDFSQYGIFVAIDVQSATSLHISNTKVMNNALEGIAVLTSVSTNLGPQLNVDFDHLTVTDNNTYGIRFENRVNATVVNSDISNNGIANGGCDVHVQAFNNNDLAFVLLRNLTLGPRGNNACSIDQEGFAVVIASQVVGNNWVANGSFNNQGSDHTNILTTVPPNTLTVTLN
jgi:hypothetical protein